MPTVAEQLRHAREALMMDVYQAAELTKIKSDHIRALEAGQYQAFSAPVYVRGFVRTYAKALKLDTHKVMQDLELEIGDEGRVIDPDTVPADRSGSPRLLDRFMLQLSRLDFRVVLGIITVALLVFLIVTVLRNRALRNADPLRDLGPGLYQPSEGSSGERLPLPNP